MWIFPLKKYKNYFLWHTSTSMQSKENLYYFGMVMYLCESFYLIPKNMKFLEMFWLLNVTWNSCHLNAWGILDIFKLELHTHITLQIYKTFFWLENSSPSIQLHLSCIQFWYHSSELRGLFFMKWPCKFFSLVNVDLHRFWWFKQSN